MTKHVAFAIAAALALPAAHAAEPAQTNHDVTVLHCARLVDPAAGKLLGESTLVIEGNRVKEIKSGRADDAPYRDGATAAGGRFAAVELANATCMPGLIDSHTHLSFETSPSSYSDQFRWNVADYAVRSTVYARRTLMAGFTAVRNVGDGHNESIALRNAMVSLLPSPTLRTVVKPASSVRRAYTVERTA